LSYKLKIILAITTFSNLFIVSNQPTRHLTTPAKAEKTSVSQQVIHPLASQTPVIKIKEPIQLPDPVVEPTPTPKPVVTKRAPAPIAVKATPKITPKRTPTVRVSKYYTCEANSDIYFVKRLCEVFGSQGNNALIIAFHESRYNNMALSPTNDYGMMQINCKAHKAKVGGDCTRLYDFETNLRIAKQVYDGRGGTWAAWTAKKFLPAYH